MQAPAGLPGCGEQWGCEQGGTERANSPGAQPHHPSMKLPVGLELSQHWVWDQGWQGHLCRAGSVPGVPHTLSLPQDWLAKSFLGPFLHFLGMWLGAGDVAGRWGRRTWGSLHSKLQGQSEPGPQWDRAGKGCLCSPLPPCHPVGRASKDVTFSLPFCQRPPPAQLSQCSSRSAQCPCRVQGFAAFPGTAGPRALQSLNPLGPGHPCGAGLCSIPNLASECACGHPATQGWG